MVINAWRKREVTVEVTRALDGPIMDPVDWDPDVRRYSIVQIGLKRQKLIAGACGASGLGCAAASLAKSSRAACIPPMVVGRKGPFTSRDLL
jgi:hypothetical protein